MTVRLRSEDEIIFAHADSTDSLTRKTDRIEMTSIEECMAQQPTIEFHAFAFHSMLSRIPAQKQQYSSLNQSFIHFKVNQFQIEQ